MKSYRVEDVDFSQCPNDTFLDHTGREKTYRDYYKTNYNIDIKDPKQPMLLTRAKVFCVSVVTCLISNLYLLSRGRLRRRKMWR